MSYDQLSGFPISPGLAITAATDIITGRTGWRFGALHNDNDGRLVGRMR